MTLNIRFQGIITKMLFYLNAKVAMRVLKIEFLRHMLIPFRKSSIFYRYEKLQIW